MSRCINWWSAGGWWGYAIACCCSDPQPRPTRSERASLETALTDATRWSARSMACEAGAQISRPWIGGARLGCRRGARSGMSNATNPAAGEVFCRKPARFRCRLRQIPSGADDLSRFASRSGRRLHGSGRRWAETKAPPPQQTAQSPTPTPTSAPGPKPATTTPASISRQKPPTRPSTRSPPTARRSMNHET